MLRSLVGSEMCIRDSHEFGIAAAACVNLVIMGARRKYLSLVQERRVPGAVSYTHLTLPTIYSV